MATARLWNLTSRDADEAACGRGAVAAGGRHARAGLWELRRSAERRAVRGAARLERERNRRAAGDVHAGEPRVVDTDSIEPERVRSDLRAVLLRTSRLASEPARCAARPLGDAGDRDARRFGLGRSGSRWCLRGLAATTRDGYCGSKGGNQRVSTCPHCRACYAKPVAAARARAGRRGQVAPLIYCQHPGKPRRPRGFSMLVTPLRGVSAGGSATDRESPRKDAFRGLSCVVESAETR
jgi:hypothetical protein